jgi:hypothetical protein
MSTANVKNAVFTLGTIILCLSSFFIYITTPQEDTSVPKSQPSNATSSVSVDKKDLPLKMDTHLASAETR